MYKFCIESLFLCGNVELRKHYKVNMHFSTRPKADSRRLHRLALRDNSEQDLMNSRWDHTGWAYRKGHISITSF